MSDTPKEYQLSLVEEEKPVEESNDDSVELLSKLLSKPETAALLKALAKSISKPRLVKNMTKSTSNNQNSKLSR